MQLFAYLKRKIKTKKIQKGLIHYWPISESTVDMIGHQNMTIELNGELINDRMEMPGGALRLNNGYGSIPAGVYFDPETGGWTFMVWMQVVSFNNLQRIFSFGGSNVEHFDNIFLNNPAKKLRLRVFNGDTLKGDEIFNIDLKLNVWYHVAVSVTGSVASFYLDGDAHGGATGIKTNFLSV